LNRTCWMAGDMSNMSGVNIFFMNEMEVKGEI
jgi:hypothetical protein